MGKNELRRELQKLNVAIEEIKAENAALKKEVAANRRKITALDKKN
jgi:FtsZ-binding cell division protein ZapB